MRARGRRSWLALLLSQFKSPIILVLITPACLSATLRQGTDALIILAIVLGSGQVGFWQEHGAVHAVEALLARVTIMAAVIREGAEVEIPAAEVVPGDLVVLNAGDIIPADCLILNSRDLHLDEATLTGETYPVEKLAGPLSEETALGLRRNSLYMGTHVVSGTATAIAVHTGKQTAFGHISQRMDRGRPEAEFERGLRRFGYLHMEFTLILVLLIFAVNVTLGRPALEALLSSTALAVGLTPQLLPLIIGANLSHGARKMAQRKVIVKRLASIENFGSMNVLCSDKTGTLTEGAATVGRLVGLAESGILTGPEIARMSDAALIRRVGEIEVLVEVEPDQKERVLLALKKAGNVVVHPGDTINDASTLYAADVGISVDSAVDVAKEAAGIVTRRSMREIDSGANRERAIARAATIFGELELVD